jgi:hypothetical protein
MKSLYKILIVPKTELDLHILMKNLYTIFHFSRVSENQKLLSIIWTDDFVCSTSPDKISIGLNKTVTFTVAVVQCCIIT